ncbi:MAG TPA: choice-of-anchor D domain-containing protein, partial [bacterium]|nr:choice-of-anchor D domain-containing protein [bacterium]
NTIIPSTPASAGSFLWTVPDALSSNCIVKITDALNANVTDQSDSTFSITAPEISLSSTSIDFGYIAVGNSNSVSFTITNEGNGDLIISGIISDNEMYSVNQTTVTIPPDSSQEVLVTFSPTEIDIHNAIITVTSNDSDEETLTVLVSGIGYKSCQVNITVPEDEQFSDVTVTYNISDPEDLNVSLFVEYSTDDGQTWQNATIEGEISNISSSNYSGSFVWKGETEFSGFEGTVKLRVTPNNGMDGLHDIKEVQIDYNHLPVTQIDNFEDELSGDILVTYTVSDSENDLVTIDISYSLDGGDTWESATVEGDTENITADGSSYSFMWNSNDDLPGVDSTDILIKIEASDYDMGDSDISEPVHIDNNMPPSVEMAIAYTDSTYEDYVDFSYKLLDTENDILSINIEYSIDNGVQFFPATITGVTSGIDIGDYESTSRWEILTDLPDQYGDAIIKLTPSDIDIGGADIFTFNYNTYGSCNIVITLPEEEQNTDIQVYYEITDDKNHTIILKTEYSKDGQTWHTATVEETILAIAPSDYSGSFTWKGVTDLSGNDGEVFLRVTPNNGIDGIPDTDQVYVDYNEPPVISADEMSREYSGIIEISYDVTDAENDSVIIALEYSIDGGENYQSATFSGFEWDTMEDIGYIYQQETYLLFKPYDNDPGNQAIVGPFTVTNLVGDYNHDFAIDGEDLFYFSDAWYNQDMSKEIGPVIGTPPEISVQFDGKVDFEDLTAFGLMWNWYTLYVIEKEVVLLKQSQEKIEQQDNNSIINLVPLNNGSIQVVSDIKPDYMTLLIEPIDNNQQSITIISTDYWTEDDKGVVLTRTYNNGVLEIATALLDNKYTAVFEQPYILSELSIRNDIQNVSNIIVHYKVREIGDNTISTGTASLSGDLLIKKPSEFALMQNIPNPFNPTTIIEYKIPVETHVRLVIFNVSGQQVAVLKNDIEAPGKYSVIWNSNDMPSGLYFYRLRTGGFNETKKMMLVK